MANNNTVANNQAASLKRELSRLELLEMLKEDVLIANDAIQNAHNSEVAIKAINNFEGIIKEALSGVNFEELKNILGDIFGSIPAVRTFDRTRGSLNEMIDVLINQIDALIGKEEAKKDVENLRNIFNLCAEHADEIAKIIGIGVTTAS